MKQVLKTLAKDMNLQFSSKLLSGKYQVQGIFRGHEVLIDTAKKKERLNDIDYFRIFINLKNPLNIHLDLHNEDVFSKLGKEAIQQDIIVDSPNFDNNFIIRCNHENLTKEILNEKIQKEILLLQEFAMKIEVDKAYMEHPGRLTHPNNLKSRINILIDIIENIESLE